MLDPFNWHVKPEGIFPQQNRSWKWCELAPTVIAGGDRVLKDLTIARYTPYALSYSAIHIRLLIISREIHIKVHPNNNAQLRSLIATNKLLTMSLEILDD